MRISLDQQILATVLAHYPLDVPRPLHEIEAGRRNNSILVEAGSARFVLRRYRRNTDEARIEFQLRFQQALHGLGFPTADIMKSTANQLLVMEDGSPWVLFEYIKGDALDFAKTGQIEEAGRRLGEFHTRTEAIQLKAVEIDINRSHRRWWSHGEQDLDRLHRLFEDSGVAGDLKYLVAWRERLIQDWPLTRFAALPSGWVHGDYHGRNVLFVGDRMTGLFDFDVLGSGAMAADVSRGLFMFGRKSRLSRHIRPEAALRFLAEYQRIRHLSQDEIDALPTLTTLTWAPNAPYYMVIQRDGEDPVPYFRRHVRNMRELSTDMDKLLPVLSR